MSNFKISYAQVVGIEGVYDNDTNDTGGETVFGISRNNFPNWAGWSIVDQYKSQFGAGSTAFLNALSGDQRIAELRETWYKDNFWDKLGLDSINDYSLAYEIFDQSVNLGVGKTTQLLQQALNALNYNYQFGSDLVVDGAVGPATRQRLMDVGNNSKYTEVLRKAMDGLQVGWYINLGNSNSGRSNYRKYVRGWLLNRIGKYGEQGLIA